MSISNSKSTGYVSSLSPEFAVLGLLSQRPTHGYDLHHRLLTELGQVWHISQSQLYSLLKRLENQGDIAGLLQEQSGVPDRRIFHLTELGRTRFDIWLNSPSGCSVRAIRVEFITRLYFVIKQNPEQAADIIEEQSEEIRQGLAQLQHRLDILPVGQTFNQLSLDLRIQQLASILRWLVKCKQVLVQE